MKAIRFLLIVDLLCLALPVASARAQLASAGTLFVNMDATRTPVGTLTALTNAGALGGFFSARGAGSTVPRIALAGASGRRGIQFDGDDYMQLVVSVGGAVINAPPGLVGIDPTRSIEVWVLNPSVASEETMVAWGKRGGPAGSNMSFNYGNNGAYGAIGHWDAPDIGYYNTGGAPAAGRWHHIVYTYDGSTTRIYADGALLNSEVLGSGVLNTHTNTPICLATQMEGDGVTPTAALRGSLTLARVRIHDGVLSDAQVLQNYNAEQAEFADPVPAQLAAAPSHRYTFDTDPTNNATGAVLLDSFGSAHGQVLGAGASLTGSRLVLPGGPSASAAYADLPNGLLSSQSADNGGSGEISFEGWLRVTGSRLGSRILDFGSTTGGELTGPGGGGVGLDYLFLGAQVGTNVNSRRVEVRNMDGASGDPPNTADYATATFNTDVHFVLTWRESTGEIYVYENGVPVAVLATDERLSGINDVNNWLGRANTVTNLNAQLEFDEFRLYPWALAHGEVVGNFQAGPTRLNVSGPVVIYAQPRNLAVTESARATFSLGASGTLPVSYQWLRNGQPIPGASGASYSFFASFADQGAVFTCQASNFVEGTAHTVLSGTATLTVLADVVAPVLLRASALGATLVQAEFSERLREDTVVNLANYTLTGPAGAVNISAADLDATLTNVLLTTSALAQGSNYTLTVSGLRDASANSNLIAPGSSVTFRAEIRPRLGAAYLAHRYSFAEPPTNNATGLTFIDSILAAHGLIRGSGAVFNGSRLVLAGGSMTTAAYGDLPNGLMSRTSADRGGTGGFTFESWLKLTGSRTWSRIFDFGSTTGGELLGPGGGGNGLDYLVLTAQIGGDVNSRRLEVANNDGASGGANTLDYSTATFNTELHVVVTWKESTGEVNVYENGVLVASMITDERISSMNDVNMWLGRSNWTADQNTEGEYDEVRLYDGVLSPAEITASVAYGADHVPVLGPARILAHPTPLTVTELFPATFTVGFGGYPFPQFQWLRNGLPIPGATSATYTLPEAALTDDNAQFSVIVSNVVGDIPYTVTSRPAVLHVEADLTSPTLVRALPLTQASLLVVDGMEVEFSEGLRLDTATNLSNYALNGPAGRVNITGARLDASLRRVILTTATLAEGQTFTLTVNNVRDRAAAANLIAPDSQISMTAYPFLLRTVGTVTASNSVVTLPGGGFDVNAAGNDIGGRGDDFGYQSQFRSGDFDVRARVSALDLADGYAKAGWMARASLDTNSPFAAVFATPSLGGCYFQSRETASSTANAVGSFPVNYPSTWLRLQRTGNLFTGLASLDGETWVSLGAATIAMPPTVYLGFAVSSHNPAATVTARFREANLTAGGTIMASLPLPFEPLGPSSRRTGLVISEIMYHPAEVPGVTNSLEYVEIYNGQDYVDDLSGYRLTGDIEYMFPPGTVLASGGFLVVARDPAGVEQVHGITGVLGPYTNSLPNDRGTVRLRNELGAILLEVNYDTQLPWPVAPDGTGHSLVLARPSYGEGDPKAWAASEFIGGTPGRPESYGNDPQRAVVINEFLANSEPPQVDYIELFNRSTSPVNLGGAWLSDDPATPKYQLPPSTTIPGRGFLVLSQDTLGFGLDSTGEEVFLVNSNRTRVLDAVRFGGQSSGISSGRVPDGEAVIDSLAAQTPNANNGSALAGNVVINEIMYHPISEGEEGEYVEVHNRSLAPVNISGWRILDGIDFTFPANTVLPAQGYLVVAKNRTNLLAQYPNLQANPGRVVGDFGGRLDNGGERLALAMLELNVRTNAQGILTTNVLYPVVDEVTYGTGGRWGQWSDGGGSSLELVDPRADNRLAPNWADSDETSKAPWTLVERTGPIDLGMTLGSGTPNRFEFFIEGPGECLVDEMEVRSNGAANRLNNPGFESGTASWTFRGTHARSSVETGTAYSGSACLHLRAVERGDTGANRIQSPVAALPTGGANQATLRTQVRWLKGDPNILLRIRGQWIECAGRMTVPTNLGTPGAPNSRAMANTGPAITEVTHFPILPAANEPVRVTARVADPDGLASLTLRFRLDPSASLTDVPMRDDGMAGDALAGDGLFTGAIPGQPSGTMVAFHLSASDAALTPATTLFPSDAPRRECLVRFGETLRGGTIATYRMWLTQANTNAWTIRERNSNEPLDCTFVYGNRRVIYNANTLYSGSPWHTANHPYNGPLGNTCDYELGFEDDEPFLGAQDFVLNAQAGSVTFFDNDVSAQAETTAYWLGRKLGLQFNHKRHVFVVMNGQFRGMIYFDHQQPNQDIVEEYFPDDPDGRLHKIEDWFEFDDAGAGFEIYTSRLQNYTLGGQKRTERYRWTHRPRGGTDPNDFADLFTLVDAMNAAQPEPYTSAAFGLADMTNFMRVFALQHTIGNWDTWGYRRGKNSYIYKPKDGPWKLLLWDLDLVLGKSSDGTSQPLFDLGNSGSMGEYDPVVAVMYQHPPFLREFWGAMVDLVNGPLLPEVYSPLVDARYAAFRANGVPADSPASMKNWISARRAFIISQLPVANFSVAGATFLTASSNSVTLTGTAPVAARRLLVNGVEYPLTWTAVTGWSLRVPLAAGTNTLQVSALDAAGNTLSNQTVTVDYTGPVPAPEDWVVINEILYDPVIDDTSFLELFNAHTNYTFDLSGWRVNGLGYTFPAGAILRPRSYLVLARNRGELAKVYGVAALVFDQFGGALDNDGETLTLLRPGPQPGEEQVVDKVKYEARAPWPAGAAGGGAALQLLDVAQDNARVSSWSDGSGWRFFRATGAVGSSANRIILSLAQAGDLFIDNVELVQGTEPGAGPNLLTNGGFELGTNSWAFFRNHTNSVVTTNVAYAGSNSLRIIATGPGTASDYIQQSFPTISSATVCTFSLYYIPVGPNRLKWRVGSLLQDFNVGFDVTPSFASPSQPNSVQAALPPYPPLWLNEVLTVNAAGRVDNQGELEPWIELYNSGGTNLPLDRFYLADNFIQLNQWAFPPGSVIEHGQFLVVVADGEPSESTATEWHTSFRLAAEGGAVALSRARDGSPQILDYIYYPGLGPNRSYGSFPDGQLFDRQEFFYPTPGGTNNGAAGPLPVYINEWTAANTSASGIADPADGDFDDWFELYNPNTVTVDLAGYYLTDILSNPSLYRIPTGYRIPPQGFLLVWADRETGQNAPNQPDLHADFRLEQNGEAIGLFAPDGTLVDTVTFGQQTNNVSQGHYPDGTGPVYFLTLPTPRAPNYYDAGTGEQPEFSSVVLEGNQLTLTWSTQPGRAYRVEYTDDLTVPLWLPLGPDQVATGLTLSVVEDVTAVPQRFYRVVRVN